ncbi:MAG: hypothetical protein AB1798_01770 [Spirochaetota bacterium]
MKRHVCFLGTLWEMVRFIILLSIITLYINPLMNRGVLMLLVYLGSAQLLMAAGFFFMWSLPGKYSAFARLLTVGKLLGFFSGASLIIFESGIFQIGAKLMLLIFRNTASTAIEGVSLSIGGLSSIALIIFGFVAAIDFSFFIFLLFYKPKKTGKSDLARGSGKNGTENLPEWKGVRIEEE